MTTKRMRPLPNLCDSGRDRVRPSRNTHLAPCLRIYGRAGLRAGRVLHAVAAVCFAALAAGAATVRPQTMDEALINPGMGLVHYAYSSRIWAYDTGLEPGDTLDDLIPGTSVVYMRLPWSYIEPEEGVYRWDILDVKARPWIAAGKKLAFRFAVMDHTMNSIPDWAMKAGIKGKWHHYRSRPEAARWFEPEWDDPVLLAKH